MEVLKLQNVERPEPPKVKKVDGLFGAMLAQAFYGDQDRKKKETKRA